MNDTSIIAEQKTTLSDDNDLYHSGSHLTATTTIVGLVNGMISGAGICVVLPQLGLTAGWLGSILVCSVAGFISFCTARLIVVHLGKGNTVKECILEHFNQDYRYMRAYGGFIWFNLVIQLIIYFRIICLQIQGLMGH